MVERKRVAAEERNNLKKIKMHEGFQVKLKESAERQQVERKQVSKRDP